MIPMLMCLLLAAPMGYTTGRRYVQLRAARHTDEADQEVVQNDLQFLPFAAAAILPLAAILALLILSEEN